MIWEDDYTADNSKLEHVTHVRTSMRAATKEDYFASEIPVITFSPCLLNWARHKSLPQKHEGLENT